MNRGIIIIRDTKSKLLVTIFVLVILTLIACGEKSTSSSAQNIEATVEARVRATVVASRESASGSIIVASGSTAQTPDKASVGSPVDSSPAGGLTTQTTSAAHKPVPTQTPSPTVTVTPFDAGNPDFPAVNRESILTSDDLPGVWRVDTTDAPTTSRQNYFARETVLTKLMDYPECGVFSIRHFASFWESFEPASQQYADLITSTGDSIRIQVLESGNKLEVDREQWTTDSSSEYFPNPLYWEIIDDSETMSGLSLPRFTQTVLWQELLNVHVLTVLSLGESLDETSLEFLHQRIGFRTTEFSKGEEYIQNLAKTFDLPKLFEYPVRLEKFLDESRYPLIDPREIEI